MKRDRIRPIALSAAAVSVVGLAAACTSGGSSSDKTPPHSQPVPTITFLYPSQSWDPVRTQIGELLTKTWEQLGLKVDAVPLDFDTAAGRLESEPKSYEAYIYSFSSSAERYDPDAILRQGFACPGGESGGANYTHYCNPQFDQVLNASAADLDATKRKSQIAQAEEMIRADMPAVPLYHLETLNAYNSAKFSAPTPYQSEGNWYWWAGTMEPKTSDRTLKIGQTFDLGSANPFVTTDGGNIEYLRLLYDTLTRVTPEGQTVPWAAEKYSYSNDTTLNVTLRSGMHFSDGTPVTADDVKFSYELFAKGQGAAADYAPFLANVKSIDVNSPTSLTFHMKTADAPFTTVAMSQIFILPQHIWASHTGDLQDFDNTPVVGSGQFTWDYWKKNQEVSLKANKSHFEPPKIDQLLGVTFGTSDAVYQALATQQIDIHQASLLPSEYKGLQDKSFITTSTADDIGVFYLGFNVDVPPFNNAALRHALAYTVPYPTIVNTILGGYAKPGTAFIAPANKTWTDTNLQPLTYNLAKAQQILSAAKFTKVNGVLFMPSS